ncbi:hypothetical protein RF11_11305 [Thelohanellus kitauei]|uniref:Uncharacterized protein n=1 Tax=Thelohanellus kitauei TaxID=669202 RepID=A0A0C2M2D1_THEKT|nr:hypothetical protein RF11_11305 [Thelohanellus kitauei]
MVNFGAYAITMGPESDGFQSSPKICPCMHIYIPPPPLGARPLAENVSGERVNEFVPSHDAQKWELSTSRRECGCSPFEISDDLIQEMIWILSPYFEPVHSRVQLQSHTASGIPLVVKLKEVLYSLSLLTANPDFGRSFPHKLLTLSQSCFSSRSKTFGNAAAVPLCLKDKSTRVTNHPECKRLSRSAVVLVVLDWFARASGILTLADLHEAFSKILLPGKWRSPR